MSYIFEMAWLADHGIIANWQDYDDLPVQIIDDARLVMEADVEKSKTRQRETVSGKRNR